MTRTSQHIRSGCAIAALLVACVGAGPVFGQEQHSVEIRDGIVAIDGRTIPAGELPETLNLEGLTARLSFSGDAVFSLGGRSFAVREGRLVEVAPDDLTMTFSIQGEPRGVWVSDHVGGLRAMDDSYALYVQALGERASQLEKLREEMHVEQGSQSFVIGRRMAEEAGQAVEIVRAFPRIELNAYLSGLESRDQSLYQEMMQEQLMEMESRRLAAQIRGADSEDRRRELEPQLQKRLEAIFELKQKNRRAEIEQLDQRLEELRQQLTARQENRQEIVERRMRELLDLSRD